MSFYNRISGNLIFPVSDYLTGWNVSKTLNALNKSQWWSREQIVEYQNSALKKLIKHAYNNVPYYQELFDKYGIDPESINTQEDLSRIPVLTKEIIAENFYNGKLLARNFKKSKARLKSSSGSTGFKTIYYIDNLAYGFNIAANLRGWSWMGYSIGDPIVKITQNKRKSFIKKLQDASDRTALFTANYTNESCNDLKNILSKTDNIFLRSYPDPLLYYASRIKNEKFKPSKIKAINTTGNILFPESRDLIENAFNTKIFDSYSCEGGANVFECETHENYHVSDEYGIIEIINDHNAEVEENEWGRSIVTDLQNYISPFIRYESKDILQKGGVCSCGRHLSSIKKIGGRDNDMVITPSGQLLIAQSFTTYFKHILGLEQFQVIQNAVDELTFRFKVNDKYENENEKNIISYWQKTTNGELNIRIVYTSIIEPLPSGKVRFVIRNKQIPLII